MTYRPSPAEARLYRSWADIIQRMHGRNGRAADPAYAGLSVYPEWRTSFATFKAWADANLGPRPEGWHLKRIDTRGDFAPGNLKWSDPKDKPVRSTADEEPYARANVTADGRFRALISAGTYETESEALSMAEDVLAFMVANYPQT